MTNTDHDVQQVIGIIAGARAAGEHEIVAGALALGAEVARRRPDERMEPVERAGNPAKRVANEIAAPNVGQLVEDYGATPAV